MYVATGGTLDVAKAALQVVEDPHLGEVACHVLRLSAMEEGRTPGPRCTRVATTTRPGSGIGLRYAVGPLRTFVAAREQPIIAAGVAVAVVGGLLGLGYLLAKRRHR
jgi:hypothetical protein